MKTKHYQGQIYMMCPINEITKVSALTEEEAVKKLQALCKSPEELDTTCNYKDVFYYVFEEATEISFQYPDWKPVDEVNDKITLKD